MATRPTTGMKRDTLPCVTCGRPHWWHLLKHRGDDQHMYLYPYSEKTQLRLKGKRKLQVQPLNEKTKALYNFADRMRANPTIYEKRLWRRLKNGYRGVNFEQQIVIGDFIVDFYCHEAKLAIELDGRQHDQTRDATRDSQILHRGITVLRFPNPTSYAELNQIIFKAWAEIRYRIGHLRKWKA